jgi:putative FmdB family regulatory protein
MPTYEHQCTNTECNHEWEDYYSVTEDPPKICPKCQKETAKRVITCMAKGIVKLEGQELIDKCVADGKKMAREASKDPNLYANLIGESKYNELQTKLDRRGK